MLPEVLSFGKAVAQGSFLGVLLLQLLGVALPEAPGGDHWPHHWDAPGNEVCGKERCSPEWTHGHLGAQTETEQTLKLCCSLFYFVKVCALRGFSKQEVQGHSGVCCVGLSRVALGSRRQSPRVQDGEEWHWLLQSSQRDSLGYAKYRGHARPLTHHPQSLASTHWISNVQMVLTGFQPNLG